MFQNLIKILTKLNTGKSYFLIFISIAVTLFFSIFIKNLYFDNDLTDWVSEKSSIGRLPHYIAGKFGSSTPILILLKFDDIFTHDNLSFIKNTSDSAARVTGVDMVLSIANIDDVSSSSDGIKISGLLKYPLPPDREYYKKLKKYVMAKENYRGKIVSADSSTAMIIVKPGTGQRSDIVAANVRENIDKIVRGKNLTVYYGGLPSFLNSISVLVSRDFILLIPLVLITVFSVLFFSFRTARGIFLPLVSVVFATLMTTGLMGLFHIALNVMSVTIPVVLVACGNAYGIHVLNRYYEKAVLFTERKDIIRQVMTEISLPVIISGLTAFFGFLSLGPAQIQLVSDFGIFTGIGIFFATFISLIFIPSYLYKVKIKKSFRMKKAPEECVKVGPVADLFSGLALKSNYLIIFIFGLIIAVGVYYSTKIESRVDYLGYFDKSSEPRVVADFTIKKFGGYFPYNIYIKADIIDPGVEKMLLITEERMKFYTHTGAGGIADMVVSLEGALSGLRTIPDTREEVQNLLFFLEGRNEVDCLMTRDKKESLITLMLKTTDPSLINGLESFLGTYLTNFSSKIATVVNRPDNPELPGIEKIFLGNLFYDNGLDYSNEDLDKMALMLCISNRKFSPSINRESLLRYITGDESEISLDPAEAARVVNSLAALKDFNRDEIIKSLSRSLPRKSVTNAADISDFSKSISRIISENFRQSRIDYLAGLIKKTIPPVKASSILDENLKYAISPLAWETIPSVNPVRKDIVSEAEVHEIGQTGYAYVGELLRREIIRDQVFSLAVTLIVVFLFNIYVFRSVKQGLLSMIAMPFTLIINFALMAIFKIPLDIVTVSIGSISIIGIDYTLHFIARYSIETDKNPGDRLTALKITFATAGKAIIFNALSVGLGFAVLSFSSITALRNLGFLLAMTMFTSCTASLVLLPAVLSLQGASKNHSLKKK